MSYTKVRLGLPRYWSKPQTTADTVWENQSKASKLHDELVHHYDIHPDHVPALREYTRTDYHDLNSRLYDLRKKRNKDWYDKRDSVDKALSSYRTPKDFHVYTAVNDLHRLNRGDLTKPIKIKHSGYTSSTVDRNIAGDIARNRKNHILKIHIPKDHAGAYISHHSCFPVEKEFLLPRNLRFKVNPIPEVSHYVDHFGKAHKQFIWHSEIKQSPWQKVKSLFTRAGLDSQPSLDMSNKIKSKLLANDATADEAHSFRFHKDPSIRELVADNYHTSPKTLHDMRNDKSEEVRRNVANHRNVSPKTLHEMRNDKSERIRRIVAMSNKISPETLHEMRNDEDSDVRENVAWNLNTSPETLHEMRNDKNSGVRWHVARNKNTKPETLHAMRNDKNSGIKESITYNNNTSPKTLHAMHKDKSYFVRLNITDHPNASPKTLHAMSKDKDPDIRSNLTEHPNISPKTLHAMSKDKDENVRGGVAEHPKTPPKTLHAMRHDKSYFVMENLIRNTNTPLKTLEHISQRPLSKNHYDYENESWKTMVMRNLERRD